MIVGLIVAFGVGVLVLVRGEFNLFDRRLSPGRARLVGAILMIPLIVALIEQQVSPPGENTLALQDVAVFAAILLVLAITFTSGK